VAVDVAAELGCAQRYVYLPSGSHPRKNNERAVAAFASLPSAVRDGRQLLISGLIDGPTRVHYETIASGLGAPGSVVTPGYLSDEMQLRCFQGAELVCFPSLAEGFGLPIVEAYATVAPVIASDRAPFDRLVPSTARFDPTNVEAITGALARALGDPASYVRPARAIDTWDDVAARSVDAFERLLARRASTPARPSSRRRRRRVAFVSPLPPAPTGIAGYSARLIEKIAATGKVELDCYWDGPITPAAVRGVGRPRHVRSLERVEALLGRYDDVVFTLGNSHHHLGALDVLLRRGGSVLAHDVRLTNLYRHRHGDPGHAPHGLERAIQAMYGPGLPAGIGHSGAVTAEEIERFGLLLTREAVAASDAFFVTSQTALGLGRIDAGPRTAGRIATTVFALGPPDLAAPFDEHDRSAPAALDGQLAARWGSGPPIEGPPIVATFGIVDPIKLPATVVGAVAHLLGAHLDLQLAFVGPISDALAGTLGEMAQATGVADRLVITGPLPPDQYDAWMRATTVAVQLRASTNGEASATLGECLALGVPTIASAVGWPTELPPGAVELVPAHVGSHELAGRIETLLRDEAGRRALGARGRRVADDQTFDRAARELLAALCDTPHSRP
jgi:glycosyltransferase involved in cell wall biosynthesis